MITSEFQSLLSASGHEVKPVFTPMEAAAIARRGKNQIYSDLASRKLRAVKHGRVFRIPASALMEYLEGNTQLEEGV